MKPIHLVAVAAVLAGGAFAIRKLSSKAPPAPPAVKVKSLAPPKSGAGAAKQSGSPSWGTQILGLATDIGTQWTAARAGNAPSQTLAQATVSPSSQLLKVFS